MVTLQQTLASKTEERQTSGVINPYALVEAILKRRVDWKDPSSFKLMSETLQTDYHELFDPKFNSPLYAGYRLNLATGKIEQLKPSEIQYIEPTDQVILDLSKIKKIGDLKNVGVEKIEDLEVSDALVANGKLKLTVKTPSLDKTMTNSNIPKDIASIVLPWPGLTKKSATGDPGDWTPDWGLWKDVGDFFKDVTEFSDPIQGGVGDCWLIAAMAAVA